jgi:hypothetical protein
VSQVSARRTYASIALMAALASTAACEITLPPSTPQTPEEVEALRRTHPELTQITVAMTATAQPSTVDAPACQGSPDALGFVQKLFEQRMSHAGFHLVADPSSAKVVMSASMLMDACVGKAKMGEGSVTYSLSMQGDGSSIDVVSKTYAMEDVGKQPDKNSIPDALVQMVMDSAKLSAFAKSHTMGGGASAGSPSDAPAAPSTPAPAPAATGCAKDTDCKGDRICNNGVCQAPH